MMGRGMPMDVNEWVIRPAADERQRDRPVSDPDDHHAPVRGGEALRHNRLLATSPVRDIEIIIGKWLAR